VSRERTAWAVASVVALAVLFSPLVRGRDGFPLSNYPMFADPRDTAVKIRHVIGVTADDRVRPLPPRLLGTDEIMQANQIAMFAIRNRKRAEELCTRVAADLATRGDEWAELVRVEVRTDRYDAVRYWLEDRRPLEGRVHAACEVPR
jgi:hypothetical protein